jgi:hypothetical protein
LKGAEENIPQTPVRNELHELTGPEDDGVEHPDGIDYQTGNEENDCKDGEDKVLDAVAAKVVGALAELQEDIGHIVNEEYDTTDSEIAANMRQGKEGDGNKVVNEHDVEVLVVSAGA